MASELLSIFENILYFQEIKKYQLSPPLGLQDSIK